MFRFSQLPITLLQINMKRLIDPFFFFYYFIVFFIWTCISLVLFLFCNPSNSSHLSSSDFGLVFVHFLIICLFILLYPLSLFLILLLWNIYGLWFLFFPFDIAFFVTFITALFHRFQSSSMVVVWLTTVLCAVLLCVPILSVIQFFSSTWLSSVCNFAITVWWGYLYIVLVHSKIRSSSSNGARPEMANSGKAM